VTVPWKHIESDICRNLQKAANFSFSSRPLVTAFKLESVQAGLDEISTTSGNGKRRIDELHWNVIARSLREFHNPNKRQKLQPKTPSQFFQSSNKVYCLPVKRMRSQCSGCPRVKSEAYML
jgi:hypothetical protein